MAVVQTWQTDLLAALGVPAPGASITALSYWAASEGMPLSENNWLATTLNGYGGYVVNSAGVKAYPTVADGVAATAATLRLPAYTAVVTAFRDQAGAAAIWQAVNASPWCKGCQGGKYPVALYDFINGAGAGGALPTGSQPTLSEGATGAAVKLLQTMLDDLGAHLVVDGDFGPLTRAAVIAFQTAQHITADGVVGPVTWQHLQSAVAQITAPAPIPPLPPLPAPNLVTSHVDPSVDQAWSTLGDRTGRQAAGQLAALDGAVTVFNRSGS